MVAEKQLSRLFIKVVSFILTVSFLIMVVEPSRVVSAKSTSIYKEMNLSTQHMFKPLVDGNIGDKGMLEYAVLGKLRKDPNLLFQEGDTPKNLFSKLTSGKTIEVFFSSGEILEIPDRSDKNRINNVFIIPATVGEIPYYIQVLIQDNGSMKTESYSMKELEDNLGKLVSEGLFTEDDSVKLLEQLSPDAAKKNNKVAQPK